METVFVLKGEFQSQECYNQTFSNLEKLNFISPALIRNTEIVQQFNELNVRNLGHFTDNNGYHYIVFNSHQNGIERQIKIYIRYNLCHFELYQTISAQNFEKIALFKLGINGLLEQYLVSLDNRQLSVWKKHGTNFCKVVFVS